MKKKGNQNGNPKLCRDEQEHDIENPWWRNQKYAGKKMHSLKCTH